MTVMTRVDNARFIRWQERCNTQLGFVNNTVLALTTAGLGLGVSSSASGWHLGALRFGTVSLIVSVLLALGCALNRLWDFRETARIARGNMSDVPKAVARGKVEKRGRRTWRVLYWQLSTFALGALALVVALWPRG